MKDSSATLYDILEYRVLRCIPLKHLSRHKPIINLTNDQSNRIQQASNLDTDPMFIVIFDCDLQYLSLTKIGPSFSTLTKL